MSGIIPLLPLALFAQTPATNGPTPAPGTDSSLVMLAFRRFWSGLTLSPVDATSNTKGLLYWGAALALLLVLALVAMGPKRALRQLLDVRGHGRLLSTALRRLRFSTRLLGFVVGMTVVTWTSNQFFFFSRPLGRDDQLLLLKGRSLGALAMEQGALAALTPLRDVFSLGSMIPLMMIGAAVLFHYTSDRFSSVTRVLSPRAGRESFWGTVGWGALGLHAVYRFLSLVYNAGELPLGGLIFFEAIFAPALMAAADGVILAWVLVEIRNAGLGDAANETMDVPGVLGLLPATMAVCLVAMPGRYVSGAVALILPYLPGLGGGAPGRSAGPPTGFLRDLLSYVRWQLGEGLFVLQAVALIALPAVGAAAWSNGRVEGIWTGACRLMKQEGARVFAAALLAGLASIGLASAAYFAVLAIPTQSWVLTSADAYSHYATLPVGLVLTACLVEMARRTLPRARATEPARSAAESDEIASQPLEVGG